MNTDEETALPWLCSSVFICGFKTVFQSAFIRVHLRIETPPAHFTRRGFSDTLDDSNVRVAAQSAISGRGVADRPQPAAGARVVAGAGRRGVPAHRDRQRDAVEPLQRV